MLDIPGLDLVGPIARAFDLISSEYGWDDEIILNKTLKRIRQILASITLRKKQNQKEQRLSLSWQTRSLAMVMAASGGNANEEIMKYAASLTIDNEEYAEFNNTSTVSSSQKLPVHASTQQEAVDKNYERAADSNNFEMLQLMMQGMQTPAPGQ